MIASQRPTAEGASASRRASDLPRVVLPAWRQTKTEEDWHAEVLQAVQRSYDLAFYLDAQSSAADGGHDRQLAALRADQAARAQRAYDRLRRHAAQSIGRQVTVAPNAATPSGGRLRLGDVTIDLDHQVVVQEDRELQLTAAERTCLIAFAMQPRRTWSREALMHLIHGDDPHVEVMSRTIDVHLSRLRSKLGQSFLISVPGIGWRLEESFDVTFGGSTPVPNAVARAVRDRQAKWIGGVRAGSPSGRRGDRATYNRLARALEAFDLDRVDHLSDEQANVLEARLDLILARLRQRDSGPQDNEAVVERQRARRVGWAVGSPASPATEAPPSIQDAARTRPRA
jgi:DNA-binding winged helix-turn-helix (wHTH) protein